MLTGERVTLRGATRDDLPMPQAFERVVADFEREVARGGRDGATFAIEVDGKYIGACVLHNFNATSRTAELGIAIGDRDYWGKGYGREAVMLLIEYAFRYRNFRRVWLWVHADNERAIRAYRACGFVEEGRLREHMYCNGRYVDALQMGILRSEWESR